MNPTFTTKEKAVGTFAVLSMLLLLTTVMVIGRGKDWFRPTVTYYATFNEGYNLTVNAAVKLFNTDIGKIKEISVKGDKVRLTLHIYRNFTSRIRVGTVATVESPTFIGSEYVSITPGRPGAMRLPPKTEIPTKERPSLADVLREFQVEKTAKMVVIALQNISEMVQELRRPDGPLFTSLNNIARISANLDAITGDVRAGKGTVGALVHSPEIADQVLARLRAAERILARIQAASDDIAAASHDAPTAMTMVRSDLESIRRFSDSAAVTVAQLNRILTNVEGTSRDLPAVLRSARQAIAEVRASIENADRVLRALQKNVFIRGNLPPAPTAEPATPELRR